MPPVDLGRLYDFEYARGNLPYVLLVVWWLNAHVPGSEVGYFAAETGRRLTGRVNGALLAEQHEFWSTGGRPDAADGVGVAAEGT